MQLEQSQLEQPQLEQPQPEDGDVLVDGPGVGVVEASRRVPASEAPPWLTNTPGTGVVPCGMGVYGSTTAPPRSGASAVSHAPLT